MIESTISHNFNQQKRKMKFPTIKQASGRQSLPSVHKDEKIWNIICVCPKLIKVGSSALSSLVRTAAS